MWGLGSENAATRKGDKRLRVEEIWECPAVLFGGMHPGCRQRYTGDGHSGMPVRIWAVGDQRSPADYLVRTGKTNVEGVVDPVWMVWDPRLTVSLCRNAG